MNYTDLKMRYSFIKFTLLILFSTIFSYALKAQENVILFNTPYLPTEDGEVSEDTINYAFDGGLDRKSVV